MKEIEKKEAPDVSGGHCVDPSEKLPWNPLPVGVPPDCPPAPGCPWYLPDANITDQA